MVLICEHISSKRTKGCGNTKYDGKTVDAAKTWGAPSLVQTWCPCTTGTGGGGFQACAWPPAEQMAQVSQF